MNKKLFLSILLIFMAFSCVFGGGIFFAGCGENQNLESGIEIPQENTEVNSNTVIIDKVGSYSGQGGEVIKINKPFDADNQSKIFSFTNETTYIGTNEPVFYLEDKEMFNTYSIDAKYAFGNSRTISVTLEARMDDWSVATDKTMSLISWANGGGWELIIMDGALKAGIHNGSNYVYCTVASDVSSLNNPDTDNWHVFTFTLDSGTYNYIRTYLDGIQQHSEYFASTIYPEVDNVGYIVVGGELIYTSASRQNQNITTLTDGNFFEGRIQNVYIVNDQLSDVEISNLHNGILNGGTYYVFREVNETLYANFEKSYRNDFETKNIFGKVVPTSYNSLDVSTDLTISNGVLFRDVTINSVTDNGLGIHFYFHHGDENKLEIGKRYRWSVKLGASASRTLNVGYEGGGMKTCQLNTTIQTFTHEFMATSLSSNFVFSSSEYKAGDVISVYDLVLQCVEDTVSSTITPSYYYTLSDYYRYLPTLQRAGFENVGWETDAMEENYLDEERITEFMNFVNAAQDLTGYEASWVEINGKKYARWCGITGHLGSSAYAVWDPHLEYGEYKLSFYGYHTGTDGNPTSGIASRNINATDYKTLYVTSTTEKYYEGIFVVDENFAGFYMPYGYGDWTFMRDFKLVKNDYLEVDDMKAHYDANGASDAQLKTEHTVSGHDGTWFAWCPSTMDNSETAFDPGLEVGVTYKLSFTAFAETETSNTTTGFAWTSGGQVEWLAVKGTTEQYYEAEIVVDDTFTGFWTPWGDWSWIFVKDIKLEKLIASSENSRGGLYYSVEKDMPVRGNGVLKPLWKALPTTLNFEYKFEGDITKNSFTTEVTDEFASKFSHVFSYKNLTYDYNIEDTVTEAKTFVYGMLDYEIRQYQDLMLSDIICAEGWGCVGASTDTTIQPDKSTYICGTIEIEENSTTIYLYFKLLSDNRLRYDSIDKYFYFEDGVFPQTAVVTLENGVDLEQTLASQTATTSEIDGLGTVKFVTLNGFKYMGVQVVADDGDASKTATKTVKLRDNNATSDTYLEYKDYTFSEGVYYWFRFEPIRWRVSDYGVSEDEIPTDWANFAQGQTNVEVVSDVLWFDALETEYVEVEYIELTGTQYINTGYYANQDTSVEMKAYSTSTKTQTFYCSRTKMMENTFTCFIVDGKVRHDYNTTQTYIGLNAQVGKTYDIYANKNVLTVNGVSHTATESSFTSTYAMCLGACDGYDTGVGNYLNGRIYYCKIYDDETLVRDLVPCYRKSDGVIGLYDKVNHVFYQNSGTGTFGKGKDIALITSLGVGDSSIESVLSNKIANWNILDGQDADLKYLQETVEYRNLPSEFKQLSYIECTNAQYIKTNYYANQDTKVEMKVYSTSTQNQAFYCSRSGINSNTFACQIVNEKIRHDYNTTNVAINVTASAGMMYEIVQDKNSITVNGVTNTIAYGEFTAGTSMFLGANINVDNNYIQNLLNGRIYYCKIYDEDTLVLDLVPCYRMSDNVVGMYDLVNGDFYTNAGWDTFVKGVEVKKDINVNIDVDSWANSSTNKKVNTEEKIYNYSHPRIASLSEINKYQDNLRSYASQLVCVLSGKAQNQYFEYWTRDFGQQIGAGTYVTRSGVVMKNSYYTARKGVRFAYNMSEGSNTGNYTGKGNLYDLSKMKLTYGTLDSSTGIFTFEYTNDTEATTYGNFQNAYPDSNGIVPGKKYVYVLNVTDYYSNLGYIYFCLGDTHESVVSRLEFKPLTIQDTGKYVLLMNATNYDNYSFFSRDFFYINSGQSVRVSFTVEVYEYDEYINM